MQHHLLHCGEHILPTLVYPSTVSVFISKSISIFCFIILSPCIFTLTGEKSGGSEQCCTFDECPVLSSTSN